MLRNTFLHVPGIGVETETSLWKAGCRDWDCFLSEPARFSTGSAGDVGHWLDRSVEALERREHQFFAQRLRTRHAWRAFPEFEDAFVCLDIETDGGQSGDSVTMVGLYDGTDYRCLIKGEDLESFRDVISNYQYIVTFFGNGFDLPMLQRRFPGIVFDQIHLDLCPTLRELGYRGGLKKIEKQLGISRGEETDGLSGWDAVKLWRRYVQFRDDRSLETLVAYNREDVVNLHELARIAYRGLKATTLGAIA